MRFLSDSNSSMGRIESLCYLPYESMVFQIKRPGALNVIIFL